MPKRSRHFLPVLCCGSVNAVDDNFRVCANPSINSKSDTTTVMSNDSFSCNATSDLTDVTILTWMPSAQETDLMKRTFSYEFDDLYKIGASIFTYIFEKHPKTQQLFPSMIKYGDNWKTSKEFLLFSTKFAQVLSHAVKNVAQIDTIASSLYSLGAMHVDFEARGFNPNYWNMFVDAMGLTMRTTIEPMTTLNTTEKSEAVVVWRRLAHFVISHMKRGFNDRKQMLRNQKK